jgi:hypothetical protein
LVITTLDHFHIGQKSPPANCRGYSVTIHLVRSHVRFREIRRVMFRVTCLAKVHQLMKLAKLMCGVPTPVPPRVRFLIVRQVQQFGLMTQAVVVAHVFDLANLRVEHAVTIRPVHQLDRSRMFVEMKPRVLAEPVAPVEFRLVLTTRKVARSQEAVRVQQLNGVRDRVQMPAQVIEVNVVFRRVLVLLVAICQRQSQLAC